MLQVETVLWSVLEGLRAAESVHFYCEEWWSMAETSEFFELNVCYEFR